MCMGYCKYCDGVIGATQVRGTLAKWIREAGIHTWVWVLAVPLTGLGTSGKSPKLCSCVSCSVKDG